MLLDILNSFYNFFHIRGSAFQSYIGYMTGGEFGILYTAIQFMLINKIIELTFVKRMFHMQKLKVIYIVVNILFTVLILSGMLSQSVIALLTMDVCIIIIYAVNAQVGLSGVPDLHRMSVLNKRRGVSSLVTFVIGMTVASLLKKDLPYAILTIFSILHLVTFVLVLYKWNIEIEEKKPEPTKRKFEVEPQVTAYMLSGVFMSISSVFDLYYVQKTLENGYSLSMITTLASVGALISGIGFIIASSHHFEMKKLRGFITASRLMLGIFPFLVLLNFPLYPILKVIVFGIDGFIVSIYQSLFLSARDKRSLAYMSSLRATIGYATFSGAVFLVGTGVFSLWALAVVSLLANVVSAVLLRTMKEQGFRFLSANIQIAKNYSLLGEAVVLVHSFTNTKSKIGDVGTVQDIDGIRLTVKMDNGELLRANVHSFGVFKYGTIRQLIYSYEHIGASVSRIKIGNKIYDNPDLIFGAVDPDKTIVVTNRLLSDGTLEILKMDKRTLFGV